MGLTARDIMESDFIKINKDAYVSEAARLIFYSKPRGTGFKPLGILVVDEMDRLVGVISMKDILFHLRPFFMNYELESYGISEEELESHLHHFDNLRVEQVMSSPVVTASPEESILVLMDKMTKRRVRRIPVLDGDKILGVVYLSDIFYHVCKTWLKI